MSTSISTGDNNNNNNNNNSFVVKTNKQTNKGRTARIYLGFYLKENEKDRDLLERIEVLRARDGCNLSEFFREVLGKYVQAHFPGNPGLPLTHWLTGEPLSEAAAEKIQIQPKSRPLADFLSMTVEELKTLYMNPRISADDSPLVAYHLKNRGISVEELRKMRESRMP